MMLSEIYKHRNEIEDICCEVFYIDTDINPSEQKYFHDEEINKWTLNHKIFLNLSESDYNSIQERLGLLNDNAFIFELESLKIFVGREKAIEFINVHFNEYLEDWYRELKENDIVKIEKNTEFIFQAIRSIIICYEGILNNIKFVFDETIDSKTKNRLLKSRPSNVITGFKSNLTDEQIAKLFDALNGNYINTILSQFIILFRNKPLPDNLKIEWIDKGTTRHEPNKQTLYEFLFLLKHYGYLSVDDFDTSTTNLNNLYRKLERIFPNIKNFASSNPQALQRNTPRQKELEILISSLKS